jgi:MFS family permease
MTQTSGEPMADALRVQRKRDREAEVDLSQPAPYGWWPAVLIALVSLVDRIETQIVAGVLPLLQAEWGFSDTAAGAIPMAAALAGIIATLPAGYLADKHNRKNAVAVVVAIWSVITLGSGLAPTFAIFFLTRLGLGFADVLEQPAILSLIADKYSPKVRSRAYGWQRMTFVGGAPIGALLGAVIGQIAGWRWAFFFMVIPGLIVAWLVYRLREPERGAIDRQAASAWAAETGKDEEEILELLQQLSPGSGGDADVEAGETFNLWRSTKRLARDAVEIMQRSTTIRYIFVAALLLGVGLSGVLFWLPTLFVRAHDMDVAQAGALTGLVFLVGVVVGTELGGRLGMRVHGRVSGGRLLLAAIGLGAGSLFYFPAVGIEVIPVQLVSLLLATGLLGIALPNVATCIADVVVANRRGRAFALLQVITAVGAALGPLAIGVLSDLTGSLVTAILLTVPFASAGGFLMLKSRKDYDREAQQTLLASR